jgi:broad specificity phosphatase PhoE
MQATLPQTLWLVRHGQRAGNVARDAAEAGGLHVIDIAARDLDVPLSSLGVRQAQSLGRWFSALDVADQPQVILCSPCTRAELTARLMLQSAGIAGAVKLRMDERLREKEFGMLDRLTRLGIREKHPELHEQRTHVGKFYFRSPGGESWCDVILRLRSLLEMVTREYGGQRVLLVAHQVVAGSREIPGAAILAAMAALRSGAGKLTIATAKSVAPALALAVPEARVIALPETTAGGLQAASAELLHHCAAASSAVLIGPGLLDAPASYDFVQKMLRKLQDVPVILDALAMDIADSTTL